MYHHVSQSRTVLTLEHKSSRDIAIKEEFSVFLSFTVGISKEVNRLLHECFITAFTLD